jgi:hypothetical protein
MSTEKRTYRRILAFSIVEAIVSVIVWEKFEGVALKGALRVGQGLCAESTRISLIK